MFFESVVISDCGSEFGDYVICVSKNGLCCNVQDLSGGGGDYWFYLRIFFLGLVLARDGLHLLQALCY